MKIQYGLEGEAEYEVETRWSLDSLEYIAEDAAEDYYVKRDGWESSWPLEIELFNKGESLGVFEVGMEHVAVFQANEL